MLQKNSSEKIPNKNSIRELNLIEIIKENILFNYDLVQKNTPNCQIWPVLKSNAYGHGIQEIATILKERSFQYLVVNSLQETQKIREVSNQPILIIGLVHPDNYHLIDFSNITLLVQSLEEIEALGKIGKKIRIHLKINTGMNRQGINLEEIPTYINKTKENKNLELEGICSHFADADGDNDIYTKKQKELFESAITKIKSLGINPKYVHLSNTAGSVLSNKFQNAVRLGIGLYGFNPLPQKNPDHKKLSELKPALRFLSTIAKTRDLNPGDLVSYNCTYEAKSKMRIGILPAGYYEVFDRRLSNKGCVKFNGKFLPIVGRVCMNLTMFDLLDTNAKQLDTVEIISPNNEDQNSIVNIAKTCGTIPYEVLVKINETNNRVVV